MSTNIDLPPPSIDAVAVNERGQFEEVWKSFFINLKNFLDAYVTSSGFLPPMLTTAERDSIVNPEDRTVIWLIDIGKLQVRESGVWKTIQTV